MIICANFYKAAERFMWCSVFLAIAVFPVSGGELQHDLRCGRWKERKKIPHSRCERLHGTDVKGHHEGIFSLSRFAAKCKCGGV